MKYLSFGRILLPLLLLAACSRLPVQITGELGVLPDIYPDYKEVTVPVNIAPLNFRCDSLEGPAALILTSGERRCTLRGPVFDIPVRAWRELTEAGDISATVCVKGKDGWKAFLPFTIHVSPDPIDPYVAYRLIAPGYETWNRMGLYQRCLEDFTDKAYMTNEETDRNCMNCHSFCNRDPGRMMFHMRARNGGTFTWDGTTIEKLNTKTPRTLSALVYPRWHPSGRYIAFSVNDIAQFFHSTDPNRIEVYDSVSDVVVYDVENHEVSGTPLLMDTTRLETLPAWAPDGNPSKPFLLPQQDTRRDARLLCSYNVPEFITGPVTFDPAEMARVARTDPGINVTFRE